MCYTVPYVNRAHFLDMHFPFFKSLVSPHVKEQKHRRLKANCVYPSIWKLIDTLRKVQKPRDMSYELVIGGYEPQNVASEKPTRGLFVSSKDLTAMLGTPPQTGNFYEDLQFCNEFINVSFYHQKGNL